MPSASQNTDAMTLPADGTDLPSLVPNDRLLSTVLTTVWILECKGESKSHP